MAEIKRNICEEIGTSTAINQNLLQELDISLNWHFMIFGKNETSISDNLFLHHLLCLHMKLSQVTPSRNYSWSNPLISNLMALCTTRTGFMYYWENDDDNDDGIPHREPTLKSFWGKLTLLFMWHHHFIFQNTEQNICIISIEILKSWPLFSMRITRKSVLENTALFRVKREGYREILFWN